MKTLMAVNDIITKLKIYTVKIDQILKAYLTASELRITYQCNLDSVQN